MIFYFDGSAKPNPGKIAAGIVYDETELVEQLGHGTNNEAEWLGFLMALEKAIELGHTHITVKGDSKLVIQQAKGNWRVKQDHLKVHHKKFLSLKANFVELKLEWIPRDSNLAGVYLDRVL